jgi:hypothetical protein
MFVLPCKGIAIDAVTLRDLILNGISTEYEEVTLQPDAQRISIKKQFSELPQIDKS